MENSYADFACSPQLAHEMMALCRELVALKFTDEQIENGILADLNETYRTSYVSRKQLTDSHARYAIEFLKDRLPAERLRRRVNL